MAQAVEPGYQPALRDLIPQHADSFDIHFYRVTRAHLLCRPWRSRVDDISWRERHIVADVAYDLRRPEQQV